MLENEIWGNSIQNWIISILIIVAAIVIVKLITLLSKKVLKTQSQEVIRLTRSLSAIYVKNTFNTY